MRLLLVRHGLAVDRMIWIEKKSHESLRPLVEKGRQKSRKVGRWINDEFGGIDLLVTSPLVRAQQTAEILASQVKVTRLKESSELSPEAPPQAFVKWLEQEASQATSVVVVGHEPHLSTLAAWLLAGMNQSFIELKKSGVIWLEVESFDGLGPQKAQLKKLYSAGDL